MRALLLPALAFVLAAAGPALARAEEPETLTLSVGEETKELGVMPRCDDLTIVAVKASGRGVRGVKPGATTCSFDRSGGGGIRSTYRIVVVAPTPPDAGKGAPEDPATPKG